MIAIQGKLDQGKQIFGDKKKRNKDDVTIRTWQVYI